MTRWIFLLVTTLFVQGVFAQTAPQVQSTVPQVQNTVPQVQNTVAWQRLEYTCANGVSLSQVIAAPAQMTLIFNDAFYVMKQVSGVGQRVRYEDGKTLLWIAEEGVGRLEQNGQVLAEVCVLQPDLPVLTYLCSDDVTVQVQYVNEVASISVVDPVYGDQSFELPKATSDSGAKFSDGLTTWFVVGENGNLFEETEEVQHAQDCILQED